MDEQSHRPPTADTGHLSVLHAGSKASSQVELARYVSNLNQLRDIYIDSSLFRNPPWEILLTLYIKRQDGLRVTLTSLCASTRLCEADCAKTIEKMAEAGLVKLLQSATGQGGPAVDLTDQGAQRMDAFLLSARRG
ncbi:MAG: hypothetical protein AAGE05_02930 [Pseudomonadota bacterium]